MQQTNKKGLITALGCYLIWGLLPIYWGLLHHISAYSVLAHRIIWSAFFMSFVAILFNFQQFKKDCIHLKTNVSQLLLLFTASLLVSSNWGLYIWAISNNRVMDTSFGYYINPLLNVVLGVFIFKEKLTFAQWFSVGLATIGIIFISLQMGSTPDLALAIALTFGLYGLVKKKLLIHPFTSIAFEAWLVVPLAIIYTTYIDTNSWTAFQHDSFTAALFVGSGLTTSVPLVLFSYGARLLPLNLLGFLQYLSPTIALLIAIFYFGESFDTNKMIAFSFIWVALGIYTASNYTK
ncbi:EamA family transporter RarD [Veillonella sp. oral taxon 780]|uniref:EamA family transporter RarD n=1 Tax=Veillonella sp. oral taxon 780 TaxID=671229 RepID=UPI00021A281B|nr:EamA family transporter RarD [Veillonella sp. oral taxon 780]EGS33379.1 protein RarD [Veillonella sp. oral taxon 780 str. F0422]